MTALRGTCPSCGYSVRLRKDGMVMGHYESTPYNRRHRTWWQGCPGSLRPPKKEGKT